MTTGIRWQQHFSNDTRALAQLDTFVQPPPSNEREQQGLITAFQDPFAVGRNTLCSQGDATLLGSRSTADAIAAHIHECYLPCFQAAVEELLLPWRVNRVLNQELPAASASGRP